MDINLTLIMQAVAFAAFIWFTAKVRVAAADGCDRNAPQDDRRRPRRRRAGPGEPRERGKAHGRPARASEGAGRRDRRARREVQGRDDRARKVEAKAEADRIVAAAKAEITQEVARAKESLRTAVAELAVAGASKILKREVDPKAHADLLREIQGQL
jgi:F-type H+-transporting ATPase subunit b